MSRPLPSIDDLSSAELEALQEQVAERRAQLHEETVARLREQFQKDAEAAGVSLDEVLSRKPNRKRQQRRSRRSQTPMYVHPDDASKTWNGRGRRPGWIEEYLASGRELEELRVQSAA